MGEHRRRGEIARKEGRKEGGMEGIRKLERGDRRPGLKIFFLIAFRSLKVASHFKRTHRVPPSTLTLMCNSKCTHKHSPTHAHINSPIVQTPNTPRLSSALPSAQYIQVDGRGLGQVQEQAVDLFDVQSHVGLPLPATQHQVVHLLGTGPGPL